MNKILIRMLLLLISIGSIVTNTALAELKTFVVEAEITSVSRDMVISGVWRKIERVAYPVD
ncbi:hypothetical protein [Amphritea pacifica]|uniref:Uncharacterized protein n=1 Tax=Amphritea pacifica TaxID=2811233 RepID=A0ABS2WAR7_9GAMM|nr:hypothetical protein [Amphritea pacifica]MBN0988686.1 hypothetical protein [Amphritea pacifica]